MATQARNYENLIKDAWRLCPEEVKSSQALVQSQGWTVIELAKYYLDQKLQAICNKQEQANLKPSLAELATDKIVESLNAGDVDEQIKVLTESLDWPVFRRLVYSGRIPYRYLRKLVEGRSHSDTDRLDLDQATAQQTKYIKFHYGSDGIDKLFLGIDDLTTILQPLCLTRDKEYIRIRRQEPHPGSFQIFHKYRLHNVEIITDRHLYRAKFDKAGGDWLRNLNWANVAVVGVSVLSALHRGFWRDQPSGLQSIDYTLCLHGLGRIQANRKIEHIWGVINQRAGARMSKYPHGTVFDCGTTLSITVMHVCYQSIAEVLANVSVDAMALAFDGSNILLTSRCARAIETGYSTFTMDLPYHQDGFCIYQHALAGLLQCAEFGFGLHFPPFYLQSLAGPLEPGDEPPLKKIKRVEAMAKYLVQRDFYVRNHNAAQRRQLSFEDWHKDQGMQSAASSGPGNHNDLIGWIGQEWFPTDSTRLTNLKTLMMSHELWFHRLISFADYKALFNPDACFSERLFVGFLWPAIEQRLSTRILRDDLVNYLTRRVRVSVESLDFGELRRTQIVFPLVISEDLENYLDSLRDLYSDDLAAPANTVITAVHDHDRAQAAPGHPHSLPSLRNTESDDPIGNLRYWVVANRTLWKGCNEVHDAIDNVLSCFAMHSEDTAHAHRNQETSTDDFTATSTALLEKLCCLIRRDFQSLSDPPGSGWYSSSGLDAAEARRFRAWAMADNLPIKTLLTPTVRVPASKEINMAWEIPEKSYWAA